MPEFVSHDGSLNDDGRKLEAFLSTNLQAMESASADQLNTYPGTFKYLFSNRHILTPTRFIQDFHNTYAQSAWHIMEAVQETEQQAQTIAATADATTDLVKQLEALKDIVTKQADEIAALKEAKTEPEPKKTPRKAKAEATEEPDAEAEDESAE